MHFYNLESKEEGVLWDVKPSYVIMYDPDMAFIRQIEVKLLTYSLFLHPGMLMPLSRYKLARGRNGHLHAQCTLVISYSNLSIFM